AALRGPTGIGLVKLMRDQDAGDTTNDYTFYLTGTPDDIVAQISSGQADIAALPTNMAAILYQKTSQSIQLLAVNTLGVLYILEKGDTIHALEDLAGSELLASGQGATPEYAINALLMQSGLADKVTVTYKTEHEELATLAAAGQADLVLLPEPFVTTVLSKNPDMRIALDLTEVWQEVHAGINESELAMGCLIVNKAFAQQHPEAIKSFLEDYRQSVDTVNSDPDTAGAWVAEYKIMADAKLAASAIPNCHIVLIEGTAMQPVLEPFYQVLHAANPQSIGGKLPDGAFYYTGE
ncbi:MAG: ABC transporter substrate-binding protein, partial [Bacillota bacterium]|nr:ABC transporter substrate-binding protein [Bacillota bacterium]